ncbi:MAG: Holliday junction branch migration protein RuvA [Candidatus Schekmanbacteria bacterium]|nr:Holliday junction branch migration protein RuvA [Candidatus Schekmanbacteria bacterium]
MIAQLSGLIVSKTPEGAVIDVNGVGYYLSVPLTTFYNLPEPGERVLLQTYTYVREDALKLYGFISLEDKQVFQLLIKVSKVGPRLACNVLSKLSAAEIKQAIQSGNIAAISAVPGIGRKTAERLIMELQDKIGTLPTAGQTQIKPTTGYEEDAIAALVSLGYKQTDAQKIIRKISAEKGDLPLQGLIKEALKKLGTKN